MVRLPGNSRLPDMKANKARPRKGPTARKGLMDRRRERVRRKAPMAHRKVPMVRRDRPRLKSRR